jgi:DNA primase
MNTFDSIVEKCSYLLNNCEVASEYLNYLDTRLSKESQAKFNFGYFPDSANLNVLLSLVSKEQLQDLSLLYLKEINDTQSFRSVLVSYFEHHQLILPYRDVYGNIIALVGRTLLDDDSRKALNIAKYKNTIFKKSYHLFGLYESKESILKNNHVYVVEGQFDVIKAHEKGLTNVVALGSSNMSAYQFSLILRYTNNIILLLDNDEAGLNGRKKIVEKFGKFASIRQFYVPSQFKDIDEYCSDPNFSNFSFDLK